jgi:hypothetical protein
LRKALNRKVRKMDAVANWLIFVLMVGKEC